MATDWQAIKLEYVNSPLSLKEIAEKHDLKDATVRQRAHREDWEAERHALSQSVTQAAQEQLTDDRANQLAKFNEDDLRMARAIRAKAASMIKELDNPSALRAVAGAADLAQRIGRLALGAETENRIVTSRELPASVDEFV